MPNFLSGALNNVFQYLRDQAGPAIIKGGRGLIADQYAQKPQANVSDYQVPPQPTPVESYQPKPNPLNSLWDSILNKMSYTVSGSGPGVSPETLASLNQISDVPVVPLGSTESPSSALQPWTIPDKAPIPPEIASVIVEVASRYGIDPMIIASALANEAGGNPVPYTFPAEATGADEEVSPAQIIPGYHYKKLGYSNPSEFENILRGSSPEVYLNAMAKIILDNLEVSGGDPFQALARYNAGGDYEQGYPYAAAAFQRIGLPLPPYYSGR